LGEIAATAKRVMYTVPVKTEEDDLAGMSALMTNVPGKADKPRSRAANKKPAKRTAKSNAKKTPKPAARSKR